MECGSLWKSTTLVCLAVVAVVVGAQAPDYYTYNGWGNNIAHPEWGSTGIEFLRQQVRTVAYDDGIGSMAGESTRPSAREISLRFQLPSHRNQPNSDRQVTDMLTYIGQFFDHEFDLTKGGGGHFEIKIPQCDAKYDGACTGNRTMNFDRSDYNRNALPNSPRQQINTVTAVLDGSVIYGSSEEVNNKLRARYKGQMIVSPGNMLPDDHIGLGMFNDAGREDVVKAAGDLRANVHPPMLSFQTLFIREHNRLASEFAKENPTWTDEQIYQAARKWTVAYMQAVCYYEYLPTLGLTIPAYDGYQVDVNPSIDNFFATVSYRYGHSEVKDILFRVDDEGMEIADGHLLLYQSFFSPQKTLNADIDPILRGMSMKIQGQVDVHFASAIQHHLFGDPMHGGSDLIARDIQRCRDHGFPDYNTVRQELGLPRIASFSQITGDIYVQRMLEQIYGNVNNIDAYVGGMAEDHKENTNLGPIFYESMRDQYRRIRDGDRFYFENTANGLFTDKEISSIKGTGLRDIIMRNTHVTTLPENIYIVENTNMPWPRETGASQPQAPVESGSSRKIAQLKDDATLEYWLEDTEVHFILKAPVAGWIALGFEGPAGGMIDADIIVGSVAGGQAEVVDSWSVTFAAPTPDDSNDATLHEFEEKDGVTQIHFSRPLETSDDNDRPIALGEETKIIFAWHGSSDGLAYHGPGNRGKGSITVEEGGGTDGGDGGEGGAVVVGGSLDLADGVYKVSWEVQDAAGGRRLLQDGGAKVAFTIQLEGEGWVGLGVAGPAGGMIGADIIVASMTADGGCDIHDYWSDTFAAPNMDADIGSSDDISDATCSRTDGVTEYKFSRPIAASDANDLEFNINGVTPIIYAWSSDSDALAYHLTNRGSADAETVEMEGEAGGGGGGGGGGGEADGALAFAEAALGGSFTLMWALSGEDEIVIKMQSPNEVWLGIGLAPEDKGMMNCDIYIGTTDGGVNVGDYWSTGYAQPGDDASQGGSNDLLDFGGGTEGGVTEYWFRRKLDTGDSLDVIIEDATIDLVYAWGSSPAIGYHGPTQRSLVSINMGSSEASVSTQVDIGRRMIESHGGIMVLAWAFIGMFGVGIARFGRQWKWWLKAHRILQIGTTVVALIGEVIGFSYTRGSFRTAHSITALCVVFVTFPQVSLGAAAMRKSNNPNYNKLHRGTGYFLVGLALWQVWTGFITLECGSKIKNLYLAWILALIVAFHFSATGINQKEVDNLLKDAATPAGEKKRERRSSRKSLKLARSSKGSGALLSAVESLDVDADDGSGESEQDNATAKEGSKRSSAKSSKASMELLELIEDRSSGSGSDDSDGATGWSQTEDDEDLLNDTTISSEEFLTNVQEGKKWTIINDCVYDMTMYMHEHPGGKKVLEDIVGMDGTDSFLEVHGDDRKVRKVLGSLIIGVLNDDAGILEEKHDTEDESRRTSLLHRARASLASVMRGEADDPSGGRRSSAQMLGAPSIVPTAGGETLQSERWTSESEPQTPAPATFRSIIPSASEGEALSAGLDRKQWKNFPIESITELSDDVIVIRVHIVGETDITLPITSHIMIRGVDQTTQKSVVRCFTPLVPDQAENPGRLDILIKCYEDGRMSRYIRTLSSNGEMEIKGPIRGLEYHRSKYERIGLIGGGSGITPLWQVVEGVLSDPDDKTKICLIYQNRFEKDILLRDLIDDMAEKHPTRFRVVYILSKPPPEWDGETGRVNLQILQQYLPPAHIPGSFIMVCGPPGMNKSLGGEFDRETMARGPGLLQDLGFDKRNWYLFD